MTVERLKVNNLKITADDSLLDQMKEVVHTCPKAMKYCKSLGMSEEDIDNNIIKIFDFARDINYCSNCPGLKQCKKDTDKNQERLPRYCKCSTKISKRMCTLVYI